LPPGKYKLRLVAYVIDPETGQVLDIYELWKALRVKEPVFDEFAASEARSSLKETAAAFQADIVNTETIGEAVLALPTESEDVTYAVTKSSKPELIDNDGILVALPETESETVTLYVTISSKENPDEQETVKVKVTLKGQE
ncbi:MAG: peptidase, partial [Brevibacillus sp.]